MNIYRTFADQIATEIATGKLRPGDRLPPLREFAYARGIAASTAGRVYKELVERGLTTGEVGRGTYIRAAPVPGTPPLSGPPETPIDMQTNYPILHNQADLLKPTLMALINPRNHLRSSLQMPDRETLALAQHATATQLGSDGWKMTAASILFTGNARQALTACFSNIAKKGERIGFEKMTYPIAKTIADRLGIEAIPIDMDQHGLCPDSLEKVHSKTPLKAIYVQPSLHNPLGMTMPVSRRRELATRLKKDNSLIAIEDQVYGFLCAHQLPPLCAYAPEQVIYMDSFSKRIAPGLTAGILHGPQKLLDPIRKAIIETAVMPQGFTLNAITKLLLNGTVSELESLKRIDAKTRQKLARRLLSNQNLSSQETSYHVILPLAEPMRSDMLVHQAHTAGISITPLSAFSVSAAHSPNAVRLALAAPTLPELERGLLTIARLAN